MDFSQSTDYPEIILDEDIITGFYDFYIQSDNEKKSNIIKKYISQSSNPEITFTIDSSNKSPQYYYNQTSSTALFSMNIHNAIEDIKLSQLEFFVE
ncbi:MAG: hypothetical protein ACPHY8_05555 [Patescibacteria group bacterium]